MFKYLDLLVPLSAAILIWFKPELFTKNIEDESEQKKFKRIAILLFAVAFIFLLRNLI